MSCNDAYFLIPYAFLTVTQLCLYRTQTNSKVKGKVYLLKELEINIVCQTLTKLINSHYNKDSIWNICLFFHMR